MLQAIEVLAVDYGIALITLRDDFKCCTEKSVVEAFRLPDVRHPTLSLVQALLREPCIASLPLTSVTACGRWRLPENPNVFVEEAQREIRPTSWRPAHRILATSCDRELHVSHHYERVALFDDQFNEFKREARS